MIVSIPPVDGSPMILAGPLLVGDHSFARLSQSIDALSKTSIEDGDIAREEAAYRIGLAVGLRLGQMNGGAR